jgi:hypothetical protein
MIVQLLRFGEEDKCTIRSLMRFPFKLFNQHPIK